MALPRFEEAVKKAISEKVVANAVVVASSKDFKYENTFGRLTLEDSSPPVQLDSVFCVFSCTKIITSVAVMQCVERGLVMLDQPLASILPEFKTPLIVTGLDEATGKPIVESTMHAITLRQLLTHTSGMGYDFSSPLIEAWIQTQPPRPHKRDIRAEYVLPLTFVPGTPGKWQYSVGLDWAGKVVERVNGGVRLGEYMQENIFKPLGMTSSTFRPLLRKDIMERLVPCVKRAEDGSLSMHPGDVAISTVIEPVDDTGGGGLYSTAEDYYRLLESIVRDDGKVLKTATIDELFRPQLQEHEELQKTLSECGIPRRTGSHVPGGLKEVKWNHGLGGVVAVDSVPGMAAKGTMWWDGMANTIWFMDRETNTCAFYGSQMLPSSDEATGMLFKKLQEELYSLASK